MSTISLCMIVKNEAAILAHCLDDARSFADEIIVELNSNRLQDGPPAIVFPVVLAVFQAAHAAAGIFPVQINAAKAMLVHKLQHALRQLFPALGGGGGVGKTLCAPSALTSVRYSMPRKKQVEAQTGQVQLRCLYYNPLHCFVQDISTKYFIFVYYATLLCK